MVGVNPTTEGNRRIYTSPNRRRLIATSLVVFFLASFSLVFEKDPTTGLKPGPNDYLWIVIPAGILLAVLAWRALKVRVVTDPKGIDVVRVVGHERVPWRRLRRFEVHPTPGKQGSVVLARTEDEVLVRIWTEIMIRPLRDRAEARRRAIVKADQIAAALEDDRRARQAALAGATRPASPGAAEPRTAQGPPAGPGA
jgi:hypothetical protein